MRTRTFLAAVATAALLVGTFGVSVVAAGDAAETTGTMVVTQSTTLTADHAGNIRIAADGVTLDCAGHTVHGPGADGFVGGIDFESLRDVTIRRCVVTGFQYFGVYGHGGVNVRLEGNTSVANGWDGLRLDVASDSVIVGNTVTDYGTVEPSIGIGLTHSIGVTIQGNVVSERTRAGIGIALLLGTNGSTVVGNRVTGTGLGISVQTSSGNVLSGNTASLNQDGFSVRGSSGNTLTRNIANGNTSIGFELDGQSSSNTLTRNTAGNNNYGFIVQQGATGNTFSRNTASLNESAGFVLQDSDNNQFIGNTASQNQGDGFYTLNSAKALFSGNVSKGNGDGTAGGNGFVFLASSDIRVENNVAKDSPWACFALYRGTSGATLVGNTASGCSAGFDLSDGANHNTLQGNTASGNVGGNGFSVGEGAVFNVLTGNAALDNLQGFLIWGTGTSQNVLTRNMANRNNYGFIVQQDATGNTFAYNLARANAKLDAYQWLGATDNIWVGNNFGTTSGF